MDEIGIYIRANATAYSTGNIYVGLPTKLFGAKKILNWYEFRFSQLFYHFSALSVIYQVYIVLIT